LAVRGALLALSLFVTSWTAVQAGPTPEEYAAHVGGNAHIVPSGELKLDGHKMVCGKRPTVMDDQLDDYGAAYPGFLILNPKLLSRVSTPVKMWIHAHECGHQFRGPDEETADCFAVQRGRRQGWLTPKASKRSASSSLPPRATACISRARTGARRCASAIPTPASVKVAWLVACLSQSPRSRLPVS
jgi:hypothetical protein